MTGDRALLVDNVRASFTMMFAGLRDERGPVAEDEEQAASAAVPKPTWTPHAEFPNEPWMESYRRAWNADAYLRRVLRRFSATIQFAVADSGGAPVELVSAGR